MNLLKKNWVLVDSRIGSNNQALALADEMGIDYSIIKIEYNFLADLPNFLLPNNFFQIKSPNLQELVKNNDPELIISASRRTGFVSSTIKSKRKNVKNIQILNPNLPFESFDLIILPQHDKNVENKPKNIFRIIGALNNVKDKISKTNSEFETQYYDIISEEYAAVLIGGNTKDFSFNKNSSRKMLDTLTKLADDNNIRYFITFSRRTPEVLKKMISTLKNFGHVIFDPDTNGTNPYPSMLKKAKYVVSTCDSISMLSEVASIAKPLYLYIPEDFKSKKHLTFAYQLSDLGIAKIIKNGYDILQEYNYARLNEASKVSDYILSSILSVK